MEMPTQNKPVSMYDRKQPFLLPGVGTTALIHVINHRNPNNNNKLCRTSMVIRIEPDGTYETSNTIYKPYNQQTVDDMKLN